MVSYPKIQKIIKKFVLNENGSITKSNLIKIGILLGSAVSFIAEKNAMAATTCHSSDSQGLVTGHNSAGTGGYEPSTCGAVHDSASTYFDHSSGGSWSHGSSHSNTAHASGAGSVHCYAHTNDLNMSVNPNGSAKGTHSHGVSHQSTGPANTASIPSCSYGQTVDYKDSSTTHCNNAYHCSHSSG